MSGSFLAASFAFDRNYSIGPITKGISPEQLNLRDHQLFLMSILLSGDLTQKEKARKNLQSKKMMLIVSNSKTRFLRILWYVPR